MNRYFSHGGSRTGWQGLARWLKDLEPFSNGGKTFRGGSWEGTHVGWLQSDAQMATEFKNRGSASLIDYVVYSYSTPIAWHDLERGWVDPGHSYSPTTAGKHYGPTKVALSNLPE